MTHAAMEKGEAVLCQRQDTLGTMISEAAERIDTVRAGALAIEKEVPQFTMSHITPKFQMACMQVQ